MTTIRISRLPEIKNDRVSADDYLIINDGDIVTSKVTFEEFVFAIGAQDIEFTGDVLYTGDVVFEGAVTGDFYNKDQTYSKVEIDQIVRNLNDYNVVQDARITAIETLIGRPSMSTDLGVFPGNIIPDNCTIIEAFDSIEEYCLANRALIEEHFLILQDIVFRVEVLEDQVKDILVELNGIGGNPNPSPDPDNPDGVLQTLEWLIGQVNQHELRITAIEKLLGTCDISGLVADPANPSDGGCVTCTLLDHESRTDTLETKAAVNDAENAALITLSGVGTNSPSVGGTPIVSNNLESFTYLLVPHFEWNETLGSQALDGTSNKEAFQLQLDAIRTRSPIEGPVFTEQVRTGQKYGITGPVASPSMIPMFHNSYSDLDTYKIAGNGTTDGCEGSFAYVRTNAGYTPGVGTGDPGTIQGRAFYRNQNKWIELLSTINRAALWDALGLVVAINDANATANGVKSGYIYVQKDSATDPDSTGLLKVNGVNTGQFPRA